MSVPIEVTSWTETFVDDALQRYIKNPEQPFLDTDDVYKLHELVQIVYERAYRDGVTAANERHNRARSRAHTVKVSSIPEATS
jgi:hypothetical protein